MENLQSAKHILKKLYRLQREGKERTREKFKAGKPTSHNLFVFNSYLIYAAWSLTEQSLRLPKQSRTVRQASIDQFKA